MAAGSNLLEREETATLCGGASSLTSLGVLFGGAFFTRKLVALVVAKALEALRPELPGRLLRRATL